MKIKLLTVCMAAAIATASIIYVTLLDTTSLKPGQIQYSGNLGPIASCTSLNNEMSYEKRYQDYALLVAGKDGWLFRSKQDLRQKFDISKKDIALYRTFSDVLKKRGTSIVLAIIPTRGIVAHKMLPQDSKLVQDYDPVSAKEEYVKMIEQLNENGVLAAGTPEPASGASYFNHADQHWSTAGAREMAQSVATLIKDSLVWKDIPKESFKTIAGKEITYDGRFGEATQALCGSRPQPEKDMEMKTFPEKESDESALFDEKPVPEIVLVGTSNSKREEFDANFSGALKEVLSADVLNLAISGGGKDDSLIAYLVSESFKENPPKFLIWEIPGYYDLGGEGMRKTVRQAIASAYGSCEKPLAKFGPEEIQGKQLTIIGGIEDKKILPETAYLEIGFDEAVKKDFSVFFQTTDGKNSAFKFQPRREDNGNRFYYLPNPTKEGIYLSSISMTISEHLKGGIVTARLCPIPD